MCYWYYTSLRLYLIVFYRVIFLSKIFLFYFYRSLGLQPAAGDAEANLPQKKDATSHALLLETATGNYDTHGQSVQTAREV